MMPTALLSLSLLFAQTPSVPKDINFFEWERFC